MKLIADLHIHSPYSRATSRELDPINLTKWSIIKGINILGTGDVLHPDWRKELADALIPSEPGLFSLRPDLMDKALKDIPCKDASLHRFLLSGEISCIYKQGGKVRKIHHLILFQDLQGVESLAKRLSLSGNLGSDGRPILGIDSRTLLLVLLEEAPNSMLIPAHAWTPWFSIFGSHSGFDSIQECFGDLSHHIKALETGLSSDPPMNRLVSSLDGLNLISNSDAHSPKRLGREANILDIGLSYHDLIGAISTGKGLLGTLEFFPEEGKYHLDGHRACGVRLGPEETRQLNGLCPKCHRPLTRGVLYRVKELSDRVEPLLQTPFYHLIPLEELISEVKGCSPSSKLVQEEYLRLISSLGPELNILMGLDLDAIEEKAGSLLRIAVQRMRERQVMVEPGYDGQYGRIKVFGPGEIEAFKGKKSLFLMERATKARSRLYIPPSALGPPIGGGTDPAMAKTPNKEQKEFIEASLTNLLVQAGPGTGKTFSLVHRIGSLVRKGISPKEILCLTFTRKAKEELSQRLKRLLGGDSSIPKVLTFHSLCAGLLVSYGDAIGLRQGPVLLSSKETQFIIASHSPGQDLDTLLSGRIKALADAPLWLKLLLKKGLVPSEGIELLALEILRSGDEKVIAEISQYRHLFIDEYQDTNPIEIEILKSIKTIGNSYICAIGDKNQAIYGFRGVSSKNFDHFQNNFGQYNNLTLKHNYRSQKNIIDAACSITYDYHIIAENNATYPIHLERFADEKQEARWIAKEIRRILGGTTLEEKKDSCLDENIGFSDIAVLYRLNEIGETILNELRENNIPSKRITSEKLIEIYPVNLIYHHIKASLYKDNPEMTKFYKQMDAIKAPLIQGIAHKTAKEILLESLRLNQIQEEAQVGGLIGFLLGMAEGFGTDISAFLSELAYEGASINQRSLGDGVALMSLHASKGLEWEVVFIAGLEDGILPLTIYGDCDLGEEKRLLYVGVTRARTRLYLTTTRFRTLRKRQIRANPSPLLELFPKELLVIHGDEGKKRRRQLPLFVKFMEKKDQGAGR